MAIRKLQEINAGSMADIAFLLLIFFLVTTTMDTDMGMIRKLPPDIESTPPPVREKNILVVLVNSDNQLLVEGTLLPIGQLREVTKEFIANPFKADNLPTIEVKEVKYFGALDLTPKHIISLRSHRGTSYSTYVAVQNELAAAYNELKEELAQRRFNKSYEDLKPVVKEVLDDIYSAKISEAEPVSIAEL